MIRLRAVPFVLVVIWSGPAVSKIQAQDLEPKAYSASPVGTAFLVVGLARSTGAVVTDPTLPLSDVEAKIGALPLAAGYTFGLFGKLALATATLPYSWGDITGRVGEDARAVTRSGLADMRGKLSVNLVGNPAMRAREFARAPRRTIVGASLTFTAPSGQYEGRKLINLGSNRWSFKPEVGVSVPRGKWDIDAYLGVWLFGDNPDYYPGAVTRSQAALVAVQAHGSYSFKPRFWFAVDATWYRGGASTIGDGEASSPMSNSRVGATFAIPVGSRQSLKVAYSGGMVVRTGTDFKTVSVGWQWIWLTKK